MKNDTLRIIVMSGALVGTTISAQEPPDVVMFGAMQAAPMPPMMWNQPFDLVAVEPFEMGEPVQDAPYSAEIVTEVTQEFADGNRIERRTTSMVARDGRGRVRREQQLAAIGPVLPDGDVRMVTINDPVARVHYSLDPMGKVAMRTRPPASSGAPKDFTVALPPPPPGAIGARATMMFERHVTASPSENVRSEKLGSKEIEGVVAEGSKTTMTIPAGAIGNVRAIEITSERWYSPELRVVVYSRRSDPRFGETTYRLTNVVRAEPDPTLFQVPADYKTEEVALPPMERMKRRPPVKE
jgi:hypothetical protein